MKEYPKDIMDIDDRINDAKKKRRIKNQHLSDNNKVLAYSFRAAMEFVSPVLVGLCMGYFSDKWLGFKAIFTIVFSLFGCLAGMLNVYRMAKEFDNDLKDNK